MTDLKNAIQILALVAFPLLYNQLAVAGPILFTVGPDANSTPQQLVALDPSVPSAQSKFLLGNGAAGFTGGIAYAPNANGFYVISQDKAGNSELNQFTLAGGPPAVPLFKLGNGFTGGLTFDTANSFLYTIASDAMGASSLYRLNLLGGNAVSLFTVGAGFTGGLAFNANNNLFYAISNDKVGNSTLDSISLAGVVTPIPIALGQGFTGGLAYDPSASLFYAINNDSQGNSTWVDFSLASLSPTAVGGIGPGFNNAALTVVPTAVPEPTTLWLIGAGLLLLGSLRKLPKGFAALTALALFALSAPARAQYSAPIHDVDSAARQPIQADIQIVGADGSSNVFDTVYVVPLGKRFVIESVTGQIGVPSPQWAGLRIEVTTSGYTKNHFLRLDQPVPLNGFLEYFTTLPVRFYADPGSSVLFRIRRNITTGSWGGLFTVSGYLVNLP